VNFTTCKQCRHAALFAVKAVEVVDNGSIYHCFSLETFIYLNRISTNKIMLLKARAPLFVIHRLWNKRPL